MMRKYPYLVSATVLFINWFTVSVSMAEVEFSRDIQPLLAQKCLTCHGVDENEGGLRLHERSLALAELDSGDHAIVAGKPEASALLDRVKSDDPDLRMPPEGDPLTDSEIRLLSEWISEGAKWQLHWAYRPLKESTPKDSLSENESENAIDQHVLAGLRDAKIEPSPAADPYTLVKRLHYDLVGLSPEIDVADAFAQNPSDAAYEQLVDSLLESPHFGERWGRHWLDKARYADSDGYEKDNHRADAWRYRDWVIDAINQDLPFDQFTVEQLAGDLLPDATESQKLATAFHRQTLTNTEGGTDKEQWRVAAVMDRTETLGTVWLGLSVGCARCHNHKYDQITQSEYYQLFACFNNGDEVTTKVAKSPELANRLTAAIKQNTLQMEQREAELLQNSDDWLPSLRARLQSAEPTEYHVLQPTRVEGPKGVDFKIKPDNSILVSGANPETATYSIYADLPVTDVTGVRLEALPNDSLASGGPGRTTHGNFVLNEIVIAATAQDGLFSEKSSQTIGSAKANFSQSGWPVANAFDGVEGAGRKGTGWAISPEFGKPHAATFAFSQRLSGEAKRLRIELRQTYGSQHTLGNFRLSAVTGNLADEQTPPEILKLIDKTDLANKEIQELVNFYRVQDARWSVLAKQKTELQKELDSVMMDVRVIRERTKERRNTHVLRRGEFKQPLEQVDPGTLTCLPTSMVPQPGLSRLALAKWLVDGKNPLVPRVVSNQIWRNLFGEGIVPTMNDFGVRGDLPSHPELLDHLAIYLIESGWSRKALIKHIVMSKTYQQSSQHRVELVDLDPSNRLLHRQNRFRVEAEIIRDVSLGASGLLSTEVGGPSVFPPIPPSITDLTYNSSFKWKTSEGANRYRRGMYTYFKRTAPHPNLITFDCPDSNVTNVARERSNTPIGALVLLNNQTFVEAAQGFSRLVLSQSDLADDRNRVTFALRRCIIREPDKEEVDAFLSLLETSRQWYRENPADAEKLTGSERLPAVDPGVQAAWIATLRVMLNLDEFLTRE